MVFEIALLLFTFCLFIFLNKRIVSKIQFFIIFFFTLKYTIESFYVPAFYVENFIIYLCVFLICTILYNYYFEKLSDQNSKKSIKYISNNLKNVKVYFFIFLFLNILIITFFGSPILESGDLTRAQQSESPLLMLISKTIIFFGAAYIYLVSVEGKKIKLLDYFVFFIPLLIILFLYNSRLLALMLILLYISMRSIFNISNTKLDMWNYRYYFFGIFIFIFIFPFFRYNMSVFDTFYMVLVSDILSEYRALALVQSYASFTEFDALDYVIYILTAAIPSSILSLIDINKLEYKINPGVLYKDEIGNAVGGYRFTEPGNIMMSIGNDIIMVIFIILLEFILLILISKAINKMNLAKIYLLPYLYFLPLVSFFYNFASAFSLFLLFFLVLNILYLLTFLVSKKVLKMK